MLTPQELAKRSARNMGRLLAEQLKARNAGDWTTITEIVTKLNAIHGTQAEAARQCGVDKTYWCRLTSGSKDAPSDETLARMGVERRIQYRFKKGTK
jgi:hypothetical protein